MLVKYTKATWFNIYRYLKRDDSINNFPKFYHPP